MHIRDLAGKSICILGFGKEGRATTEALEKHAVGCRITIADQNQELRMEPVLSAVEGNYEYQLGEQWLNNLDKFDVIIKSPGVPPSATCEVPFDNAQDKLRTKMTSATQIFLHSIRDTGAIVIGVTGSKGKSTTSTLIYEILKAAGKDVLLVGNIGEAAIAHISDAKPGTIFVMEMSSYQLMDLSTSPEIAVITTFFPEHLDYHGSLESYKDAKAHIARHQRKSDIVFFNASSDGAKEIAFLSSGKRIPFSRDECPLPIGETHLLGDHNRSNIAAAYAVAMHLGVPSDQALEAIRAFRGLPHRLESLGVHHGIEWIDDAISTNPASTIAALDALGDRVRTIILGGQDRGFDYAELGTRIARSDIRTVILFPKSGPRIRKVIEDAGATVQFFEVSSMEEAVQIAKDKVRSSKDEEKTSHLALRPSHFPIVLLSTASPSYGMFKNFEEKGEQFAKNMRSS